MQIKMLIYKLSTLLLCLLSLLGTSGCVRIEDQDQQGNTGPTPQAAGLSDPNAGIRAIALDEPNSYYLEIPVPAGSVVVQKQGPSDPLPREISLASLPETYVDKEVVAGGVYRYVFGAYADKSFQKIREDVVTVPLDLVVQGTLDNSQGKDLDWSQYRRIFLRDGATITTHGANLKIVADELYSWKSTIRSFVDDKRAEPARDGRPGGNIEIQARRVSGSIKFILNGEHGGNGVPGAPYSEPAAAGKDGNAHYISIPIMGFGRQTTVYTHCIVLGNPDSGQNGLAGRNGTNGGNGGSSGSVMLNYIDEVNFQYEVEAKPGGPGIAGAAGPGQPGGHRGNWQGSICGEGQSLTRPHDGIAGAAGLPGQQGVEGKKIKSCIHKNNELVICN
jgi:hypothetical protein